MFGFTNYNGNFTILQCRFRVPPRRKWRGPLLYYEALAFYSDLVAEVPCNAEGILNTPIWFNKFLSTKFDLELAQSGFIVMQDLFINNEPLNEGHLREMQIRAGLKRKLCTILRKIPVNWVGAISRERLFFVARPLSFIQTNSNLLCLPLECNVKTLYIKTINKKARVPIGFINWSLELELEDKYLRNAVNLAKKCKVDMFRVSFQFKINTQTLATNEYLNRYRVLDNNTCSLCNTERDSTLHSIWQCPRVQNFIQEIFLYLDQNCNTSLQQGNNIMEGYIFGFCGRTEALNQILLELKIFNFYFLHENLNLTIDTLKKIFLGRLRKIIAKEKVCTLSQSNYEEFEEKWKNFTYIYDFRGPLFDIIG